MALARVQIAATLSEDEPNQRLDIVLGHNIVTTGIDEPKIVLRQGIALLSCEPEPFYRLKVVLRNTTARSIDEPKRDLSRKVSLLRQLSGTISSLWTGSV